MDFALKEEIASVQQLAQQILGDFTELDKLKAAEQQGERFDAALWQALADAGLLGLDIEEVHGGTDLGYFSLVTLCEEVGRTVAPIPVIPVLVSAAPTEKVVTLVASMVWELERFPVTWMAVTAAVLNVAFAPMVRSPPVVRESVLLMRTPWMFRLPLSCSI